LFSHWRSTAVSSLMPSIVTARSCVSASRRTSTALRRAINNSRNASRRSPARGCPGRVESVVFAAESGALLAAFG
jgi:hypothetical protein